MLDGPTPWFILRRRLGLARRRVQVVVLALLLASAVSVAGAVQYGAVTAAPAVPSAGEMGADCTTIGRSAGFAVVPDHSRQLPAPSSAPVAGDTAACRRLRPLAPRYESLPPPP
jgi:hypothetical protein